jgi:hypothetical protein
MGSMRLPRISAGFKISLGVEMRRIEDLAYFSNQIISGERFLKKLAVGPKQAVLENCVVGVPR